MTLEFISLFAGIGGMDLGLERAGMRCVAQVEIDDYATKVLQKHWPDVARFRDVRECGASNLPRADLICGGFPCQDISYAGRGAGLAGERSGLWYEFARIIREIRPRYVLVENVAALLNRGMGDVLGTLASLGYDAEWSIISACAMGAPHSRERLFIVAYPSGDRRERRGIFSGGQRRNGSSYSIERQIQSSFWKTIDDTIRRMVDGTSGGLDKNKRLKGIGNAVVPQVAEFIGRAIVAYDAAQQEQRAA